MFSVVFVFLVRLVCFGSGCLFVGIVVVGVVVVVVVIIVVVDVVVVRGRGGAAAVAAVLRVVESSEWQS